MTTTAAADTAGWVRVGAIPPASLVDARLQLHHAIQVAVSAAISYIPARPDDSHTALSWSARHRSLVTEPMAAERPIRLALRVEDLTLMVLDGALNATRPFALAGRTVHDANTWLADVTRAAGLDPSHLTTRKHYAIRDHPVASGARFSVGSGDHFRELQRYWSNAAFVLDAVAGATVGASPVRCWPHHFDIATLITLPTSAGGRRPTIGVGHSPGDEWYPEPYWYVGPNPYPDTSDLPVIDGGGGHWHTKGWVGAVLPASDYVAGEREAQRRQTVTFVDSAVAACRTLLAR